MWVAQREVGRSSGRHIDAQGRHILWNAVLVFALVGCEKHRESDPAPVPLEVRVRSDTSAFERLPIRPPRAQIWMANVTPAPPRGGGPALPDALPDTALPAPPPRPLESDPRLKPPILRTPAELLFPRESSRGGRSERMTVELDVRVDEKGEVSNVVWAGGEADSSIVRAARQCAFRMRFYPALSAGRPVAVWCRQRFEMGGEF
jgi:outer membrane biosynthesis protein TonB